MLTAALVLGSAFAALSGLVAAGAASGLDRYAVRHWMPELEPALATHQASLVGALVPFYGLHSPTGLELAVKIVTLPAYFLVSTALAAGCVWLIARRGAVEEAGLWGAAFVAGNLVEVVTKGLLTRPALSAPGPGGLVHLVAFDASFPSGHALRTCLLAALVLRLCPRLWPAAATWVAAARGLLVAAGGHTVTDVAGGVLLGGFLVASVGASSRRMPVRRRV